MSRDFPPDDFPSLLLLKMIFFSCEGLSSKVDMFMAVGLHNWGDRTSIIYDLCFFVKCPS